MKDFFNGLFERAIHTNYREPLVCHTFLDPYRVELIEKIEPKYAMLKVSFASGKVCFKLVVLKSKNWLDLDKSKLPPAGTLLESYTFDEDGPIGYTLDTEAIPRRFYPVLKMK